GDPRYGEPIPAGENAGGGFHRGPAHVGEKAEGKRRHRERLDAQGRARRGQERRRPGPCCAGPLPNVAAPGAKLSRAGGRSESAGGNVERRPAETGAKIGRSEVKERLAARAAPPQRGVGQGVARTNRYGGHLQERNVRSAKGSRASQRIGSHRGSGTHRRRCRRAANANGSGRRDRSASGGLEKSAAFAVMKRVAMRLD